MGIFLTDTRPIDTYRTTYPANTYSIDTFPTNPYPIDTYSTIICLTFTWPTNAYPIDNVDHSCDKIIADRFLQ